MEVEILTADGSPPAHLRVVGFPAVTADGVWVKAILDWARVATTKEAPTRRALEKCIVMMLD